MSGDHGGARKGAGRKALPAGEKKVQITAIVSPHTYTTLGEMKAEGEGWGQLIDRIVGEWSVGQK